MNIPSAKPTVGTSACHLALQTRVTHANVGNSNLLGDALRSIGVTMERFDRDFGDSGDRWAALASKLLETPMAIVGFSLANNHTIKGAFGFSDISHTAQQLAISQSLFKIISETETSLALGDIRSDPKWSKYPAAGELGIAACLGTPLYRMDGTLVGVLCVLDTIPRQWSDKDISILSTLAEEVQLEMARQVDQIRHPAAMSLQAGVIENFPAGIMVISQDRNVLLLGGLFAGYNDKSNPENPIGNLEIVLDRLGLAERLTIIEQGMRNAWLGKSVSAETVTWSSAGVQRSLRLNFTVIPNSGLHFGSVLIVANDITEEVEAELRREILVREMTHRMGNILSVTQAVVSQSLVPSRSLSENKTALQKRLHALSQTHAIFNKSGEASVLLSTILMSELGAMEDQVNITGDDISLNSSTATILTLFVHELATNALKYGALSNPAGQVSVNIGTSNDVFSFAWIERGGPPVGKNVGRGFGRTLIERLFSAQLGHPATMLFEPEGVTCHFQVPLARVIG